MYLGLFEANLDQQQIRTHSPYLFLDHGNALAIREFCSGLCSKYHLGFEPEVLPVSDYRFQANIHLYM
jgi:hypothetical protein